MAAIRCVAAVTAVAVVSVVVAASPDGGATARSGPELVSRMKGAFFGATIADALSLGTHYEYDAVKIKKFYGNIDRFYAPGEKTGGQTHGVGWGARNYHNGNGVGPAKKAGETTDYGDYNILVLEHLAATADKPRRISLKELIPRWRQAMRSWRSWICSQSRQTMQQLDRGASYEQLGGMSNAMSLRSSAALAYYATEEDVAHAARTTMFTHRETTALDGGEFFSRVAFRIARHGMTPKDAIESVAAESSRFVQSKVRQALEKVAEATTGPLKNEEYADDLALTSMARLWEVGKTEPIKVGKASPTEGVLPGSVYFIVKYNDFAAAAKANAMVGGDSASRAVAIGMVLGASGGVEAIPAEWRSTFVNYDKYDALLNKLPEVVAALRKPEAAVRAEL